MVLCVRPCARAMRDAAAMALPCTSHARPVAQKGTATGRMGRQLWDMGGTHGKMLDGILYQRRTGKRASGEVSLYSYILIQVIQPRVWPHAQATLPTTYG